MIIGRDRGRWSHARRAIFTAHCARGVGQRTIGDRVAHRDPVALLCAAAAGDSRLASHLALKILDRALAAAKGA